jgi:hypothetical protein
LFILIDKLTDQITKKAKGSLMNKIIFILALVSCFNFAQSYKMNVNLKNGTKLEIPIDEIRKLTFESSTKAEELNDLKKIVESFKVMQNYPNPFNPSTTIVYQIPKAALVEVKIYDLNGSLIKEVFSGLQSEGEYRISWDGRNQLGYKVASGIYIYTVKCDEQLISKQMMLLK